MQEGLATGACGVQLCLSSHQTSENDLVLFLSKHSWKPVDLHSYPHPFCCNLKNEPLSNSKMKIKMFTYLPVLSLIINAF